ncbi:MAG: hypothetical protein M1835_001368, partial [Candelina submexicana]
PTQKRIHLVRHAQGEHNLSPSLHHLADPILTRIGETQCRSLAERFPYHSPSLLVAASPLRRTIYTALLAFERDLDGEKKVVALPEAQETSDLPSDTGSPLGFLKGEMEGKKVDLTLVKEGWDSKKGKWAPTAEAITARAKETRLWLRNREENEIVLVSHGGFLHYLTEDWTGVSQFQGTGWENAEFRTYNFSSVDDSNASLVETEESRSRRHEKPLSKEEQTQLKETAHPALAESGFKEAANGKP